VSLLNKAEPQAPSSLSPQSLENIESALDADGASEAADRQPGAAEALASGFETPPLAPLAYEAPLDERPENPPQSLEDVESAPGRGATAEATPAPHAASYASAVSPTGPRWRNCRMGLNGVYAC